MLIDILPIWFFFLLTLVWVLFSVEIGFRIGAAIHNQTLSERESPVSSMSGIILGLQAFLLAFTFGTVSQRYDAKKALVHDEANVIRTTFHRCDFLPEADRARSKALLREYVNERVALARNFDPETLDAAMKRSFEIQHELWDIAVTNAWADTDSSFVALYADSVNEIARLSAMRVNVALHARIPTTLWIALLSLLTLGMVAVGYHNAIADSRRSRITPVLAIAFSLVIALIAALDHPGDKLMPVSQQPLVSVQSEIVEAPER
jgi:hypothetical protein